MRERDEYVQNGGAAIQKKIDAAVNDGKNEITVCGNYSIEKAIVIPSDFTVILDGCRLRLADGTFCGIFVNKYVADIRNGTKSEVRDSGIRIIGKNGAVLDGGNYNGLSERNWKEKGIHISANNVILFAHLSNFEISGIKIVNQRWWAINLLDCSFGKVTDVEFCSDYTRVLPDGSLVKGLLASDYDSTRVKNSDGVDIRLGSHDITIENITGFTEDDTVAVTALFGSTESMYASDRESDDIYNVTIKNVKASSFCTLVRLLNQGGTGLHDVLIENVYDDSENKEYMDKSIAYAVRVGDGYRYGDGNDRLPKNVTIRNVYGRHDVVVCLSSKIENIVCDDIRGYKKDQILIKKEY